MIATLVSLTMLHERVANLDAMELDDWIARRWVRPEEGPDGYGFAEIDIARVRLIITLRHEFDMDARALPVVLSLIDQLHDLRRALRATPIDDSPVKG